MKTVAEIEKALGPHSDYIFSNTDLNLLRRWAILKGKVPLEVASMKAVDLTNLYHTGATTATAVDSAEMFVRILSGVSVPGFNVELTRQIATEQTQSDAVAKSLEALATIAARKTFDTLPPRELIVKTPESTGLVKGPLHYKTENVIKVSALGHPIMMVGPAGCGKTTICEHVAQALNFPFYITNAIHETHQLTGFIDGHGNYHTTPFRNAFEFGGVWVADEIDAWDASALLAANSALANGYTSFPDRNAPVPRHPNFRMVATANTFGQGADRVYIGRNELDAASLDRFAVMEIDYDLNLERKFCAGRDDWLNYVWKVRKQVADKKIRHVVSSRAISMGSAALNAGLMWPQVCDIYLFKGMTKSDRAKIT